MPGRDLGSTHGAIGVPRAIADGTRYADGNSGEGGARYAAKGIGRVLRVLSRLGDRIALTLRLGETLGSGSSVPPGNTHSRLGTL